MPAKGKDDSYHQEGLAAGASLVQIGSHPSAVGVDDTGGRVAALPVLTPNV